MLIEKVDGSGNFVSYGCMTSGNFTNPGIELEEFACRAGTVKSPSSDSSLPTIALESLIRYAPTGNAATNITDFEIYDWVVSGASKKVKLVFGQNTGDVVLTGPGYFNQQTLNGPNTGAATGGVTFNFSEVPVKTTAA